MQILQKDIEKKWKDYLNKGLTDSTLYNIIKIVKEREVNKNGKGLCSAVRGTQIVKKLTGVLIE